MIREKICPICNQTFQVDGRNKYCLSCRIKGCNFICVSCGKVVHVKFDTYRRYLKDVNHVWQCSKCGLNNPSSGKLSICACCGREFNVKTTDRYCNECKNTGVVVQCGVCKLSYKVDVVKYMRETNNKPNKVWVHRECSAQFRKDMWTDEMRQDMLNKLQERLSDTTYKEKWYANLIESHQTSEYRELMSTITKKRMVSDGERERISKTLLNLYASDNGQELKNKISIGLCKYNQAEEVRKKKSERLLQFYSTVEGIELNKRHSEQRKAFFQTEAGLEERIRMSERQKQFYATVHGKEVLERAVAKRKIFLQTEEGQNYRKRQSKVMKAQFKTKEGKEMLLKGRRTCKLNQIAKAESVLDVDSMRMYWNNLSDADLLAKHKDYLLHTLEYDFWVTISEQIYNQIGRCSRRDLSKATGILYGTVVWSLNKVGVPPLVKEYRKELEDNVAASIRAKYAGEILRNYRPTFLCNENGNRMELDIYIPEYRLAVEVNGTYWHSEKYGKDKNYHYMKSKLCREQGIRLIHVWEHEWNNPRQRQILESMFLSALGLSKKVYARKLSVEYRPSKEMRDFFNNNNIQGFRGGQFAACLVDKDTSEVYMSYLIGKGAHMSKGHMYEVVRGASKLGYTVVGGSSKLLSAILNDKQLDDIVYYID